jgi:hypothetical protein
MKRHKKCDFNNGENNRDLIPQIGFERQKLAIVKKIKYIYNLD